jgi:mannitol/fructose-specific phosphotransferase system IIA component (Ntr-type)
LKALARISSLLKDKFFRKSLLSAKTSDEVMKIIQEEEKLKH